jgi:hypothetical protein
LLDLVREVSMRPASFLFLSTVVGLGCSAPAPEAEPEANLDSAQTATAPAPAGAVVDPNTVHVQTDDYTFYDDRSTHLYVCTSGARPALLQRIRSLGLDATHVVVERGDGTWDSRDTNPPVLERNVYFCPDGGDAYVFWLWQEPSVGHLRNVDLSAAFSSGITFGRVSCSGGFSFSRPFDLNVSGFKVEDGKLTRPEVTLSIAGGSTGAASGSCSVSASSGTRVFMAGLVPVVYQVEATFSLGVSVSKATTISASIGTNGGTLETNDPSFTFTPSVSLGVTFYGIVGGYVGADMPVSLRRQTGCTPEVNMSVNLKAGIQAGLLGAGNLPISKSIGFEASTPALGPFTLREARCN